MSQERLFTGQLVGDFIEQGRENLAKNILRDLAGAGSNETDDVVIARIAKRYALTVPTLLIDKQTTQIQANSDGSTSLMLSIPFTGDAKFFNLRPSTFGTVNPSAQVQGQKLNFGLRTEGTREEARTQFSRVLALIKEWLSWLEKDISTYNSSLPSIVQAELNGKRKRDLKLDEFKDFRV